MKTRVSSMFGIGLDVEVKRINMKLQMQLEKRNDGLSLRNLLAVLREADTQGKGHLDYEEFEEALPKYK